MKPSDLKVLETNVSNLLQEYKKTLGGIGQEQFATLGTTYLQAGNFLEAAKLLAAHSLDRLTWCESCEAWHVTKEQLVDWVYMMQTMKELSAGISTNLDSVSARLEVTITTVQSYIETLSDADSPKVLH